MKLEKIQHRLFWEWFTSVAGALERNPEDQVLVKQIGDRVMQLHPNLSWEIGPGRAKPWQFVVSPSLDRSLRPIAREIVSDAPELPNWEFFPARQRKDWNFRLTFEGSKGKKVSIDASNWTFVLLEYPSREHEILLTGSNIKKLNADDRWYAAALTLESLLGEGPLLDYVDSFDLSEALDPRFQGKERPITELRTAVMGRRPAS